jgi:hypothetical protein
MKTKLHSVPSETTHFHAVDFFRNVKVQIAKETQGMSFEQFKQYIAKKLKRDKAQRD